jgi:hypothetical protein
VEALKHSGMSRDVLRLGSYGYFSCREVCSLEPSTDPLVLIVINKFTKENLSWNRSKALEMIRNLDIELFCNSSTHH